MKVHNPLPHHTKTEVVRRLRALDFVTYARTLSTATDDDLLLDYMTCARSRRSRK